MSSEQFYQWVSDGVMGRRGTISLLVGVALGWTGATLVNDSADDGDGDESPVDESDGSDGSTTAAPTATAEPTDTAEPTATETPRPTTETETQEPTVEPTATSTPSDELGANLDVSSRGFGDETSYQVLYSIINRNDVAVVVDFAATVSLRNGETLRQERTATIDPGQAANDEFVFEGYEGSPTSWSFSIRRVRRA